MYGDTGAIRQRATELRDLATEVRSRAVTVALAAEVEWKSSAADRFTEDLASRVAELKASATQLDEAANALDAHAQSVDSVKQAIEDAAQWVSDRWNDATRLVNGAVETLAEGAGRVFEFFGQEVPNWLVDRANDIVRSTPSLPPPGSRDWLDLGDNFTRNGWRD